MNDINFTTTTDEDIMIQRIVKRAMQTWPIAAHTDSLSLTMDVTATHCNGCRLNLERLYRADDFDFFHDIVGIMTNLNRTTGKLKHFLPRFAAQEVA